MRPIKPRPLPKRLRTTLERMAGGEYHAIDEADARAILAALEHAKALPTDWHAELRPPAGCGIEEACRVLCEFARRRNQFAVMEFSGLAITASPTSKPGDVVRDYHQQCEARRRRAGGMHIPERKP